MEPDEGPPGSPVGTGGSALLHKLARLRQMGPREVSGRLVEVLRTGTDWLAARGLVDPTWEPTEMEAAHLLESLAARDFFGIPGGSQPGAEFARRFPTEAARVQAVAEDVIRGRIRLFGEPRQLDPGPPDWHLDWTSGGKFPVAFYRASAIHRLDGVLEGRAVWETNRQQYLVTLAQAYSITGEERFAQRAVSDMVDWIAANPPFMGINWSEPLECAFRCLSWLWTLRLLSGSGALGTEARAIFGSIWLQARHTQRHLSAYRSPNTHVLGEALGLLATGALLPGLRDADTFRKVGMRVFWHHLDRQVAPDGSHREHSTYYHAYTTEMALMAFLLSGGEIQVEERRGQLERMSRYLAAQVRPDGTLARMGDDDGGRALRLSEEDYYAPRALLRTLEAVTGATGPDLRSGHRQDCFWYLGASTVDSGPSRTGSGEGAPPQVPPAAQAGQGEGWSAQVFSDVGVGILRFTDGPEEAWAAIHGNPMGFLTAGHSHASLMAVELAMGSHQILVDPGTFRYVAEARGEYRDFRRHNVLHVEGVEHPRPEGPFKWSLPPDGWTADLQALEDGLRATRVVGLEDPRDLVRHERCIRLLGARSASLEDRVTCQEQRRLEFSFHLPPGSEAPNAEADVLEFDLGQQVRLRLTLEGFETDSDDDGSTPTREWYWMSRRYGQRERALCLRIVTKPCTQARTRVRFDLICP